MKTWKKKCRFAGPEIFLMFVVDLDFSWPWFSEIKVQIKRPIFWSQSIFLTLIKSYYIQIYLCLVIGWFAKWLFMKMHFWSYLMCFYWFRSRRGQAAAKNQLILEAKNWDITSLRPKETCHFLPNIIKFRFRKTYVFLNLKSTINNLRIW